MDLGGSGAQGQFTYRELHADTASPQPSSSCSGPTHVFFQTVAGGGVFRFQDGSLLTVGITEGSLCIDFTAGAAHLMETYQITVERGVSRVPVRHSYVDGDVDPGSVQRP